MEKVKAKISDKTLTFYLGAPGPWGPRALGSFGPLGCFGPLGAFGPLGPQGPGVLWTPLGPLDPLGPFGPLGPLGPHISL